MVDIIILGENSLQRSAQALYRKEAEVVKGEMTDIWKFVYFSLAMAAQLVVCVVDS